MVMSVLLYFLVPNWKSKNAFWTFINVHFLTPKWRLENQPKKALCEHNALNFDSMSEIFVSIFFQKKGQKLDIFLDIVTNGDIFTSNYILDFHMIFFVTVYGLFINI